MKQAKGQKKAHFFDICKFPMDLGRFFCLPCLAMFRVKKISTSGERPLRLPSGGVMIVANHTGFADPFIMGSAFWYRRIHFLAAEVVMKNPFLAMLLRGMGCIKIDRRAFDIEAIKKSVSVMKEGRVLTVFPQGELHKDGDIESIKSGAVLMAMQAGVPIIPIYSRAPRHWYSRRVAVIGEPFLCSDYCTKRFPSAADTERVSLELLNRISECERAFELYTEEKK